MITQCVVMNVMLGRQDVQDVSLWKAVCPVALSATGHFSREVVPAG